MENELYDIYVEEDAWLLSAQYKHELAKRLCAIVYREKQLSRLSTTDWLATIIQEFCEEGGRIFDGDGDEIIIHDEIFDDAYFDDTAHSWNSDVRRFAKRIPAYNSPEKLTLRLQLFDAAFRILGEPIDS